ncbi:MAG: XTP/dITP diphosphatase [Ktedonobacteraceae bacterium]
MGQDRLGQEKVVFGVYRAFVCLMPDLSVARKKPMRTLLLATTNEHKLIEFRAIFRALPFQLLSLRDVHIDMDVEEIGTTFAEIALLKARVYAQAANMLALADDSGLEIDALGGAPGIYSARFAGRETPYAERFRVILARLQDVPPPQRTARFRCAIALAEPSGYTQVVEGTIEGLIAESPCGEHGFGYDPLFFVPEFGKTTAEMAPEEKNQISHRGRAAEAARRLLENWPLRSNG